MGFRLPNPRDLPRPPGFPPPPTNKDDLKDIGGGLPGMPKLPGMPSLPGLGVGSITGGMGITKLLMIAFVLIIVLKIYQAIKT